MPSNTRTPPICPACGGDWRRDVESPPGILLVEVCKHCTRGAMSEEQLARWKAHKTQPLP